MRDDIEFNYDEEISAYTARFPEHVTFENLCIWRNRFHEALDARSTPKPVALILDTNKHDFESNECLKLLREILVQLASLENGIYKIAFIQPEHYRKPEIVNNSEAYFANIGGAKSWLMG